MCGKGNLGWKETKLEKGERVNPGPGGQLEDAWKGRCPLARSQLPSPARPADSPFLPCLPTPVLSPGGTAFCVSTRWMMPGKAPKLEVCRPIYCFCDINIVTLFVARQPSVGLHPVGAPEVLFGGQQQVFHQFVARAY